MPHRILIVYGTTEGQTRKIARALAETMRSEGADVDVKQGRPPTDPRPEDYDAVIVAASVHAGGYQRGVRRWVKAHAQELAGRPTAFVSVCLGVLEHNPTTDVALAAIAAKFFALTGWKPPVIKTVAGALSYTKYHWLKRWMMRRIAARTGGSTDTGCDHEYTDWDDVQRFGRGFVGNLRHPKVLPVAG